MSQDPVVILSARRTPIGAMLGAYATVPGHALGAAAIRGALESAGLDPALINEVVMGCVLPAGQGQAPARQAAIAGGVPKSVPTTTVNKMCGSGMRAVMYGADHIAAGSADFVLAGGLESMTNAPYLLPKARAGYRMGHGEILDHMFYDGLQSPWDGKLMGCFADATAAKYGFTRADQDAFAAESVRRAIAAIESGAFDAEIAAVKIADRKGERVVARDETPFTVSVEKIPSLKPAFGKDGTVTAASSSSIADGASALVLARGSAAAKAGLKPVARIVAHASHAQEPEWFTIAPVGAIQSVLKRAGWKAVGRGSLRGQRSLRRRHDGCDEGHRHPAREGQRARRRLRARSSDRCDGSPYPDDARARLAAPRQEARPCRTLHRRRRGDRGRDRAQLSAGAPPNSSPTSVESAIPATS